MSPNHPHAPFTKTQTARLIVLTILFLASAYTTAVFAQEVERQREPVLLVGKEQRLPHQEYLSYVEKRMNRSFYPPNYDGPNHPSFEVCLHNDGSVKQVKLRKSSGITSVDESVKKAIQGAAPYKPFPLEWGKSVCLVIKPFARNHKPICIIAADFVN